MVSRGKVSLHFRSRPRAFLDAATPSSKHKQRGSIRRSTRFLRSAHSQKASARRTRHHKPSEGSPEPPRRLGSVLHAAERTTAVSAHAHLCARRRHRRGARSAPPRTLTNAPNPRPAPSAPRDARKSNRRAGRRNCQDNGVRDGAGPTDVRATKTRPRGVEARGRRAPRRRRRPAPAYGASTAPPRAQKGARRPAAGRRMLYSTTARSPASADGDTWRRPSRTSTARDAARAQRRPGKRKTGPRGEDQDGARGSLRRRARARGSSTRGAARKTPRRAAAVDVCGPQRPVRGTSESVVGIAAEGGAVRVVRREAAFEAFWGGRRGRRRCLGAHARTVPGVVGRNAPRRRERRQGTRGRRAPLATANLCRAVPWSRDGEIRGRNSGRGSRGACRAAAAARCRRPRTAAGVPPGSVDEAWGRTPERRSTTTRAARSATTRTRTGVAPGRRASTTKAQRRAVAVGDVCSPRRDAVVGTSRASCTGCAGRMPRVTERPARFRAVGTVSWAAVDGVRARDSDVQGGRRWLRGGDGRVQPSVDGVGLPTRNLG
ncbi:hypothetical protein PsYK624_151830 [Phanerochaete sordida]|uniref:Uncharacterized protein n=1 Tax=Phanerochaete sordida TaxID=48140 RepID=A0A9P3GNV8_9APHY|nr:hypothetical protein PsYK624_151830 [Phanerochaete sordida]